MTDAHHRQPEARSGPQDDRSRHRQFEDEFLRRLHERAERLIQRRGLPASRVIIEPMPEGADAVTATLSRIRRPDAALRESLPGRRASGLRFQRRRWSGLLNQTVARLRARVLTDTEALASGQPPRPIGRDDVLDALARYDLLPSRERPSAVVLASPTGFTEEALALVNISQAPTLVLLTGRADGGWSAAVPERMLHTPWAALFELESQDQRLARLLSHLERSGSDLASRGVAIPALAGQLGLPEDVTVQLVRQAVRQDPRLMTVVHDGRLHVCRSPLMDKEGTMQASWMSTVRRWLGMKPTIAEQMRTLTSRRVQLEQERVTLDQRVEACEAEEREALARGSAAMSEAERRQIAARLVRVRTELKRARAQEQIATQQINILSTHIYHLTLREQGRRMELPNREELTREAAAAEQIIRELSTNSDLARGIEVQAQSSLMVDEEDAILKEFDQLAASRRGTESAEAAGGPGERAAGPPATGARAPLPPVPEKGIRNPEAT